MNVFKIALHNGQYSVSTPNYPGGDVVPYETARDLQIELDAERAKVVELRRLLESVHFWFMQKSPEHYNGCGLWIDVDITLNETKPTEPKRIN